MFTFFYSSELKRRLKAEKKAKEKVEKEQQNENAKPNAKTVTKSAKQEEEISPNVFLTFIVRPLLAFPYINSFVFCVGIPSTSNECLSPAKKHWIRSIPS